MSIFHVSCTAIGVAVIVGGVVSASQLTSRVSKREEVIYRSLAVDRLQGIASPRKGIEWMYDYLMDKGYTPREIMTCILPGKDHPLNCFKGEHPTQSHQERIILRTDPFGLRDL